MSEAERWERGSREDEIRNAFVIPTVAEIIGSQRPRTIVDIGAGTGYIARAVQDRLNYRPRWTLIDRNASRIELAGKLKAEAMSATLIVGNVFDWPFPESRFDAVLVSFTLLEIHDQARLFSLIGDHTLQGTLLIVVLPDCWIDILEHSRSHPDVISRYITTGVEIPKRDKFTNREYPFFAARTEVVIRTVLTKGFELIDLEHGVVASASAFVLTFRRAERR